MTKATISIELFRFTLRLALFATTDPEAKVAAMERAAAMADELTEAEVTGVIDDIQTDVWKSHLGIPW